MSQDLEHDLHVAHIASNRVSLTTEELARFLKAPCSPVLLSAKEWQKILATLSEVPSLRWQVRKLRDGFMGTADSCEDLL